MNEFLTRLELLFGQLFTDQLLAPFGESLTLSGDALLLYGAAGLLWTLAGVTLALLLLLLAGGRRDRPFRSWFLWGSALSGAVAITAGLALAALWFPTQWPAAVVAASTGGLLLFSATLLGTRLGAIARFPNPVPLQQRIVELQRERDSLRQGLAEMRGDEQRMSTLFERLPTGVALVAPDGRWLKVNRHLRELLGYTDEDLSHGFVQSAIHSDDLQPLLGDLQELLQRRTAGIQRGIRCVRKGGETRWALLAVSPRFKADGKLLHFLYQIQDITTIKQTERDLTSAAERLRHELEQKLQRQRTLENELSRERQQRLHSEALIDRSAKRLSQLNRRFSPESSEDASLS